MKLRRHKKGWGCIPYAPSSWLAPSRIVAFGFQDWIYQYPGRVYPYARIRFWRNGDSRLCALINAETGGSNNQWSLAASEELPPEFVEFMDEHFKAILRD